ncbi:endolytic transglycosylase MltG [Nocardiopsis sp. NPDC050513]|uniref:endolytic transglycosylase MltG n=1 Tax=Nocardiopsis sp. NPDC050513 TaxID=3364338 RepID=UPI00379B4A76
MNDRDAYPDDPSRGRVDRGDDYDPLTDPFPSQPRPRGRRARPEPSSPGEQSDVGGRPQPRRAAGDPRTSGRAPRAGAGEDPLNPGAPAPGRRRRPGPPAEPPRRAGAADALRGGRAARSAANRDQGPEAGRRPSPDGGQRPPADAGRRPGPDGGRRRGPSADRGDAPGTGRGPAREGAAPRRRAADPTQDALAALADLGGQSAAPTAPSAPTEEPSRRGRRARPAPEEPESPSPLWGDDDGPMPSFLEDDPEPEPRPRRGRRKREAPAEPPVGRRGRRRAPEPAADGTDTVSEAPPDAPTTGSTPVVDAPRRGRRRRGGEEEPPPVPPVDEPAGRRGRRRASHGGAPEAADSGFLADVPADTAALAALGGPGARDRDVHDDGPADDAYGDDSYDDGHDSADADEPRAEEPSGRRGRRRRGRGDEEPVGRRSRRRRGRRAAAADPGPEPEAVDDDPVDEDEDDGYDEPNLNDIAEAYGGSRSSRRKLKQAQKAKRAGGAKGRKRRGGNGSRKTTAAAAVALVLVLGAGGYGAFRYVMPADYSGEGSGEVVVVIEDGDSGSAVGERLVEAGVVASVRAFTAALGAAEREGGGGLVPGTYSLAEEMSGESAVAALLDPENRLGGRVTVPEGLRAHTVGSRPGILEVLSGDLGIPAADFEAAYEDAGSLGLPEYATQGPEGYLFPQTYRFDPGVDAGAVLRTMVTEFRRVAEETGLEERAEELGLEPNEVMAIAAIVQAETGRQEDMANISAVVHNRLDQGMQLQMDSTCFYVLDTEGTFLNDEQRSACEADPQGYGTYGTTGLPAGPYVAPGQEAIEAALAPSDEDYLYFALIDPESGETGFSRTLDEHNQMVAENQAEW